MIRSRLRVTASQLASRVDCGALKARITDMWGGKRLFLDKLERDWLVLSFTNDPDTLPSINSTAATTNGGFDPRDIHCGVSRRGALIVYNAAAKGPTYQIEGLLRDSSVSTPLATAPASEDLSIVIDPSSTSWSAFQNSELTLQRLDYNNIRIINSCLAQTVNLQYFEAQVDAMHEVVLQVNKDMQESGDSSLFHVLPSNTAQLHKYLASTSSISNAIVLSGLKSITRPGSTAWQDQKYAELQEKLWTEYDLEERYDEIMRKLTYVNDAIRYSLEVAKDRKSIGLERIIVYLITAELLITSLSARLPQRTMEWVAAHLPSL